MILDARAALTRALLTGVVLSFIGGKGCFGGDVSLGSVGNGAGATNIAGSGSSASTGGSAGLGQAGNGASGSTAIGSLCRIPPLNPGCVGFSLGYNYDPAQGKCVPFCAANANFTSLEACQRTCDPEALDGAAGAGNSNEVPLSVDPSGQVTSSAEFGVSGPFYRYSDSAGTDGNPAQGDCEIAGHSLAECAQVVTPPYSAAGVIDWTVGGLMCTSGTAERVIDGVGTPGMLDYGHMWGAGVGFNLSTLGPTYDASAHGVIGIAFDFEPSSPTPFDLRVELPTSSTVDEPRAWKPSPTPVQSYSSPVQVGHNVVLFQDAAPLPFYANQSAFDPTHILAVQFHVPAASVPKDYAFCIRNLSLVLGTPPAQAATDGACPPSLGTASGFAYDAAQQCLSPYSSVLSCPALGDPSLTIPSAPAVDHLPCVRRLSDGALFLALTSSSGPLAWPTSPPSAWSHVSASEWADCTADEAALVAAATACPVLPL
jgi:hypothetical protein